LERYRSHYAGEDNNNAKLDRNVRFYRNEIPMRPEGVRIDEVHEQWWGNHRFLEACHSYIQWLFPIQEAGLNPQAQILQRHEIDTFRADPEMIRRVILSFRMMLEFYGFDLVDEAKGQVVRAANSDWQFDNLSWSSHNYLRITRICKFLGELGLEHLKLGWLRAFHVEIYETRLLRKCESSYRNYWLGTVYDDATRRALEAAADRAAATKRAHPAVAAATGASAKSATTASTSGRLASAVGAVQHVGGSWEDIIAAAATRRAAADAAAAASTGSPTTKLAGRRNTRDDDDDDVSVETPSTTMDSKTSSSFDYVPANPLSPEDAAAMEAKAKRAVKEAEEEARAQPKDYDDV
jgi:hypothetical protein